MTVPAQTPVTSSIANGVTTSFPYTFKIIDADDLSVSVDGVVVNTGYSVTGVGDDAGGNVVFDVAPANGAKVVRYLNPILSRLTDYQQFGDWLAEIVNADFDRIWLTMQAINQTLTRSIKLPVDVIAGQDITEDAAGRSNKVITFDVSGNVALKSGQELIPEVDQAVTDAQTAATQAQGHAADSLNNATAAENSADDAAAAALAAANTPVAAPTHAAAGKATPVDADEIPLVDSAASFTLKRLTWANIKATLKTYFDTVYTYVTAAVDTTFSSTADNAAATPAWVNGKALIKQGVGLTTSGAAAYDFTSIPAGVKRIVIALNGVSTNGTSIPQIQLGSTTFTTSGFSSIAVGFNGATLATGSLGSGFGLTETNTGSFTYFGSMILTNESGNRWDAQGCFYRASGQGCLTGGGVSLAGVIDRLRLTTVNGTDVFDGGTMNISWEF